MPSAAGQRLTSDGALVTLARPGGGIPAGSVYLAGWAHAPDGSAYIENAGAAVPGSAVFKRGGAFTPDGAAYYTTDAPGAGSRYIAGRAYRGDGAMHLASEIVVGAAYLAGIAHKADGAIYAGSAGTYFDLPLADAGNGAVDLSGLYLGAPTFVRANPATTIGRDGLVIKGIAAAVARSCYDPTTLQYLGYYVEPQRSNLLLRSEEIDNASWIKTDTTVTPDIAISPDGTLNADLITEGVAGTAVVSQSVTATADVAYAVSRWYKRGNHDWVRLQIGNGVNNTQVWFNLNTGAVGSNLPNGTSAFVSASIKAYPNGWYRCALVASVGSGATSITTNSSSAAGDANGTRVNNAARYEWGAQFEAFAFFPSSYIPTLAGAVSRAADSLVYPISNLDMTKGTIYAEVMTTWGSLSGLNALIVGFSNNINYALGSTNTANSARMNIRDGTNNLAKSGDNAQTAIRKVASSWGGLGCFLTIAGSTASAGPFVGAFPGAVGIGIGVEGDGAGSEWGGFIKNVRGSIVQATAAQIEALTA